MTITIAKDDSVRRGDDRYTIIVVVDDVVLEYEICALDVETYQAGLVSETLSRRTGLPSLLGMKFGSGDSG